MPVYSMICVLMHHPSILYFCRSQSTTSSLQECMDLCLTLVTTAFRGVSQFWDAIDNSICICNYDDGGLPSPTPDWASAFGAQSGSGPVESVTEGEGGFDYDCYKYHP